MPDRPGRPTDLRAALHGTVGFVLDADGVIILKGEPLPGSIDALASLAARGIPYRVVTNFSLAHRTTLAARFDERGTSIDPDRIITAASATAAYTADRFAGRDLFALVAPDARREFTGQRLVSALEAEAHPTSVGAVVIGDGGDDLSYANLDIAFRLIRGGAAFLGDASQPLVADPQGPHARRGRRCRRPRVRDGPQGDGPRQAVPGGLPAGARGLRADLGRRVPARSVAMVGDDPVADVRAAQRAGLRGILVLTGKTSAATAAGLAAGTAGPRMPSRRRWPRSSPR